MLSVLPPRHAQTPPPGAEARTPPRTSLRRLPREALLIKEGRPFCVAATHAFTLTILLLACAPAPDAAAQAEPARSDTLRQQGEQLRREQRFPEALSAYRTLVGQDAGNFEDRFWVAKLESWTGQLAAAESDFVRLLEERPDDYDSRIGLADVRRWRGENSAAFGVLEDLSRSHPADPEVLRRLALVSPWEASVEYFGEHLPQQASTNGIAVSLARRSSDRFRWRAATTVQDKFDRTESRFGGEVAYRPARPLELQVSAYVAPGAELLPRQSYGLSLSRKVASRLILSADYAYLDFHDAGVQQLGPALELYAGRHWLVAGRYRYSSTRFHGIEGAEGNDGGSVSLGYLYGTANLVRVVAAAGGESFTQPSRELIGQFHAHTIAAAWRHFLTPQLGFELVYARQDRSDDTRQDSYGLRMVQRW